MTARHRRPPPPIFPIVMWADAVVAGAAVLALLFGWALTAVGAEIESSNIPEPPVIIERAEEVQPGPLVIPTIGATGAWDPGKEETIDRPEPEPTTGWWDRPFAPAPSDDEQADVVVPSESSAPTAPPTTTAPPTSPTEEPTPTETEVPTLTTTSSSPPSSSPSSDSPSGTSASTPTEPTGTSPGSSERTDGLPLLSETLESLSPNT